ncbi:hypothetical protein VPH35_139830 [Triticum aestivum]
MSVPEDRSRPPEDGRASVPARPSSALPSGTAADDTLTITDDLLLEILSRVPAKSLCRFKYVSNHWLALIHHPEHRKKLPQTLVGFFYTSSKSSVEELFLESPVHFTGVPGAVSRICRSLIDTSFGFLPNHRHIDVLDCCNGLLLCRWHDVSGEEQKYYGVEDHWDQWNTDIAGVAVYSSETGRWVYKEKRWNGHTFIASRHSSATVFLNGYIFFHAFDHETYNCLAAIDTKGETWMRFGVPGGLVDGFVQQSQGYLHYANFQNDGHSDVVRLVVYVLEDYDSQQWMLKHNIEEMTYIFGGINSLVNGDFIWIAIHPEYNLVFFTVGQDTALICYNMDRRQGINMKEITTKKKKKMKKPSVVVSAGETDEEAMARFAQEHPEYVQAELEYYWKREAEQKKKGPKKEDEDGPSTVIPIESSFEEDWADFSEEEEGCDDPTKEEFWEQFRSSDEE